MKVRYVILVAMVYILSTVGIIHTGVAQQDIESLKVIIRDKSLGYDKDSNKEIVSINITTNKIGRFIYREKYYAPNNTGYLILFSNVTHYDNKLMDNNIIFQITRPVTKSGKPYHFIKSFVTVDNQTASAWIRKSNITINGNKTINNTRGSDNRTIGNTVNNKKIPGFGIISSITITSMIYFMIRKKI